MLRVSVIGANEALRYDARPWITRVPTCRSHTWATCLSLTSHGIAMTPDQYLVARISECLARDERINALDVKVHAAPGEIVITGIVPCSARRAAVERVVQELLPEDRALVSRLRVETFAEPYLSEKVEE